MTLRALLLLLPLLLIACKPEPPLHLYEAEPVNTQFVIAEIELNTYWDYILETGERYDWQAEWYYGWDDEDRRIWGDIGYSVPNAFNIRRYFTGSTPYDRHTRVTSDFIEGNTFQGEFYYGFWDMLVWNDLKIKEGVQSLNFDETSTLDSVTVYTNQSMVRTRYYVQRYTHAFYEPEELFAAYERAIEINRNHDGFDYDAARNAWVKRLNMVLTPITYIYLTQVIVHHNNGKIAGVEGTGNISGFSRSSVLNSGRGSNDPVAVTHQTRWKRNCDMKGEKVDIAGGRMLTFGIPGNACGRLKDGSELHDSEKHYMDLKMIFNNGLDSTFVFDVTKQVRQRYKGGVITVEIDMDTIPIPRRPGGSGFDAVVKDYEEVTHEIEM